MIDKQTEKKIRLVINILFIISGLIITLGIIITDNSTFTLLSIIIGVVIAIVTYVTLIDLNNKTKK